MEKKTFTIECKEHGKKQIEKSYGNLFFNNILH